MQEGWKRRREMEAAIGREALRRAREAGDDASPLDEYEDRLAQVARLAGQATEAALEELCSIVQDAEDEVRFAARVALRASARRRSRAPELEYDS